MKLCKEFCRENFNIKLVFTSFKTRNYFSYKDPIPDDLKSFPVYKFTCVSCGSKYIDETYRYFKTRIEEHIKKDNKSHNFKHLHSTATCFDLYNSLSFEIIDKTNSNFDLKVKEALTLSLWLLLPLLSFVFVFCFFVFAVLFHLLFSLSLTLIFGIFYCLNYTSLFFHFIITHLVNILYNNYVISICPRQLLQFI